MAKGDKKKFETQLGQQQQTAQGNLQPLFGQQQQFFNQASGNYGRGTEANFGDYQDIMNRYKSVFDNPGYKFDPIGAERVNYSRTPELEKALGGYGQFADTGGYSEGDITNLRARGISPLRAVYANAQNEMARQKNLQGGYSPNFNAASAKMASTLGQQLADATQNVNARLAQDIRQGKLAGLQGLGGLSVQDLQMGQQAQMANQNAGLQAARLNLQGAQYDPRLQALQGMTGLYGATPGLAHEFGNQALGALGAGANLAGLQNQLGNEVMNWQNAYSQVPGNFGQALGNIGKVAGIVGNVAGGLTGLGGLGNIGRMIGGGFGRRNPGMSPGMGLPGYSPVPL